MLSRRYTQRVTAMLEDEEATNIVPFIRFERCYVCQCKFRYPRTVDRCEECADRCDPHSSRYDAFDGEQFLSCKVCGFQFQHPRVDSQCEECRYRCVCCDSDLNVSGVNICSGDNLSEEQFLKKKRRLRGWMRRHRAQKYHIKAFDDLSWFSALDTYNAVNTLESLFFRVQHNRKPNIRSV